MTYPTGPGDDTGYADYGRDAGGGTAGFVPGTGGASGLDLGPSYTPTSPASQYVGPLPDQSGYLPPAPAPDPGLGYTPYPGAAGPNPYQPAPAPTAYPGAPGAYPGPQPAPQYATAGVPVMPAVPGQVIGTPNGTFIVSSKSRTVAGVLGILLGGFGAGQFYRGNISMGVVQLVVTFVTCGFGALWGLIEGILVLVAQPGSSYRLDSEGHLMI